MHKDETNDPRRTLKAVLIVLVGVGVTVALLAIAINSFFSFNFGHDSWKVTKSNKLSFGLGIDKDVDAASLGVAIYPGAAPYKDKDDDDLDGGANIWAVAANNGLKVAVKKFQSSDPPEKVIAFYRQALSQYGTVLTCSGSGTDIEVNDGSDNDGDTERTSNRGRDADNTRDTGGDTSDALRCDGDHSDKGEIELKAGRQHSQHIASVRPRDEKGGSVFTLVFVHIGKAD